MADFWKGKKVCVAGGASFIGSHLTEALVERGASVRVVDNLSSGKREHIQHLLKDGRVNLMVEDLRDYRICLQAFAGRDVIFHLAADHGGRGYVDLHQADCATNFGLDSIVFQACHEVKVGKVVFASSGCIYPVRIQVDPKQELFLTEDQAGPPCDADGLYGWAKLMAEKTLRAMYLDWNLPSVSLRYFTVYGPRGKEDHAVMAMLAKAFIRQNPFEVWGNGEQLRNWTYVTDIVEGTILAAEKVSDGRAINLGTMERIKVIEAAKAACNLLSHTPKFKFLTEMPTGPVNRVADNSLAKKLLGWVPKVAFAEGLRQTAEWYVANHTREEVETRIAGGYLLKR